MFSLCLVTGRKLLEKEALLPKVVKAAVRGGVDAVMLREKDIESTAELLLLAKKVKKALGKALFLVNGRCDIALSAGADGVHLTSSSISVKSARKIMGKKKLIGKSCHCLKDAKQAGKDGADYVFIGPVYFTASKAKYGKPLGCGIIEKIIKQIRIPVIAIGGIKKENVKQVMQAGASGVAVISGIQNAASPRKAAEEYRGIINGFRK